MCCPVNEAAPDFIDEFVPGASNQTLLLLHGTVSNERDLIPLGRRAGPFIGAHLDRSANKRDRSETGVLNATGAGVGVSGHAINTAPP